MKGLQIKITIKDNKIQINGELTNGYSHCIYVR